MTNIYRNLIGCLGIFTLLACSTTSTKNDVNKFLENPWQYAKEIEGQIIPPSFNCNVYNIIDYGAISDGVTDCSKAIDDAINACNRKGGGKVLVPEGKFLTGAIHLMSNVNLHVSEGATLLFTTDKSKYLPVVRTRFEGMECMNYSPLIYAYKAENIAVTGKGTLDGQGEVWWSWKGTWTGSVKFEVNKNKTQLVDNVSLVQMVADNVPVKERIFGDGHFLRPSFFSPYDCSNILIEDVTIVSSPMWIIHPILSENITVRNLHIESLGPNNDGCDPECCKNVLIENCYFNTGDDCIAIKSGRNNDGRNVGVASENIIVRDCRMVEGHAGVAMGSEISGDVRYVFAENCTMDSPHLDRAIRIKSNTLRGGIVEHVYVRNIEIKQVGEAVLKINMFYANETGTYFPKVRNIKLENIISHKSKYAIWVKAYEQAPAVNIELNNCQFLHVTDENFVEHADNVIFKNVYLNNHKI
jgi:polygalacturonase